MRARADGAKLAEYVAAAELDMTHRQESISNIQREIRQIEQQITDTETSMAAARDKLQQMQIRRARSEAQLEEQRRVFAEEFPDRAEAESLAAAEGVAPGEKSEYKQLRSEHEAIGPVNMLAIGEYEDEKQRFDILLSQIGDLEDTRSVLLNMVEEYDNRSREQFTSTFSEINLRFKETFVEVFGGGECELTLLDPSDPLETGVDVAIQMPGKRMGNIRQ